MTAFIYVSSVCKRAVKALARLCVWESLSEHSLRTDLLVPDRDRIMRRITSTVIIIHNCPFLKQDKFDKFISPYQGLFERNM